MEYRYLVQIYDKLIYRMQLASTRAATAGQANFVLAREPLLAPRAMGASGRVDQT